MGANARQYRDPNDPCHDMATEDTLFRLLNLEFGFDLDVCATKENAKCPRYFTIEDDGLKQDWSKSTVVA